MTDLKERLARALRRARVRKGLTQEALADGGRQQAALGPGKDWDKNPRDAADSLLFFDQPHPSAPLSRHKPKALLEARDAVRRRSRPAMSTI